jgi:hypothetical protein
MGNKPRLRVMGLDQAVVESVALPARSKRQPRSVAAKPLRSLGRLAMRRL